MPVVNLELSWHKCLANKTCFSLESTLFRASQLSDVKVSDLTVVTNAAHRPGAKVCPKCQWNKRNRGFQEPGPLGMDWNLFCIPHYGSILAWGFIFKQAKLLKGTTCIFQWCLSIDATSICCLPPSLTSIERKTRALVSNFRDNWSMERSEFLIYSK